MPVYEDIRGREADIAVYTELTRRQLKNEGLFICEGIKAIEAALEAGIQPVSLMMEKRHAFGKAAELIERLEGIPVFAPPDEVIRKITGIELSRGVLCAMRRPDLPDVDAVLQSAKNIAVLEGINDDSNMGSLFRNAAGLGIDALVLTRDCADPYSRKSVRVSMGAVFRIPHAYTDTLDAGGLNPIKRAGFTCAALALCRDSIPLSELSASKCALLLGSEGDGLKPGTLRESDVRVIIPMHRGMDSLNVATAAAIAFYALQKQR
ncbi:MAG: RNA methyltransferase [Clostridia bacterium]|nr:RNA methyltransferase [Clostridia bacterium]